MSGMEERGDRGLREGGLKRERISSLTIDWRDLEPKSVDLSSPMQRLATTERTRTLGLELKVERDTREENNSLRVSMRPILYKLDKSTRI